MHSTHSTHRVQELARLKAEHGFLLAVDDAHGTLVLGPSGGGTADMMGTCEAIDVHIGTLSKAFGTHGGFVACTAEIKTLLVNFGRTYVFSTALPAPTIAGALASLEVVRKYAPLSPPRAVRAAVRHVQARAAGGPALRWHLVG